MGTGKYSMTYDGSGTATLVLTPDAAPAPTPTPTPTPTPAPTGVQAIAADRFVDSVGANMHPDYTNTPEVQLWSTTLARVKELGIRHVRAAMVTVPDDGWMRGTYGRLNDLTSAGIRLTLQALPLVSAGVEPAKRDYSTWGLDRALSFLAHPEAIADIEGLNEIDIQKDWVNTTLWAAPARAWQKLIYDQAHASAKLSGLQGVIGPSLRHGTASATLFGSVKGIADAGNIHPYAGAQPPSNNVAHEISVYAPMIDGHLVIATERGYHTAQQWTGDGFWGVDPGTQAKYLEREALNALLQGAHRSFSYELVDQGTDPAQKEQQFGIIRADGTPKPAFGALKNLLALLADPGPAFTPGKLDYTIIGTSLAALRVALFQKRSGTFYLALWQEVASYDYATKKPIAASPVSAEIRLPAPPKVLTLHTPLDGTSKPIAYGPPSLVSVPDHVVVLEIGM